MGFFNLKDKYSIEPVDENGVRKGTNFLNSKSNIAIATGVYVIAAAMVGTSMYPDFIKGQLYDLTEGHKERNVQVVEGAKRLLTDQQLTSLKSLRGGYGASIFEPNVTHLESPASIFSDTNEGKNCFISLNGMESINNSIFDVGDKTIKSLEIFRKFVIYHEASHCASLLESREKGYNIKSGAVLFSTISNELLDRSDMESRKAAFVNRYGESRSDVQAFFLLTKELILDPVINSKKIDGLKSLSDLEVKLKAFRTYLNNDVNSGKEMDLFKGHNTYDALNSAISYVANNLKKPNGIDILKNKIGDKEKINNFSDEFVTGLFVKNFEKLNSDYVETKIADVHMNLAKRMVNSGLMLDKYPELYDENNPPKKREKTSDELLLDEKDIHLIRYLNSDGRKIINIDQGFKDQSAIEFANKSLAFVNSIKKDISYSSLSEINPDNKSHAISRQVSELPGFFKSILDKENSSVSTSPSLRR